MSDRIALVADMLIHPGGAEKVFAVLCEAFPHADVFTSVYVPNKSLPDFKKRQVRELVNSRLFRTADLLKRWYPVAAWQMGRMRFDEYRVVLSSAAHLARYINKGSAIHINYCYYPFRLLFEPERYPQVRGLRRLFMRAALPPLRYWDYLKAQHVDSFVAISEASKAAIGRYYGRDADVIHSPALTFPGAFCLYEKEDFFLVVSRLERWKMLDIVVDAFRHLDAHLVIVGDGPERASLERLAGANVRFVGSVTDTELVEFYKRAKALIHPTRTEYGLTPIEANAFGTPAICWGVDGVWETMVPYSIDPGNATALFYDAPTSEALAQTIRQFAQLTFHQRRCFDNAMRFSPRRFIESIQQHVRRVVEQDSSRRKSRSGANSNSKRHR